MIYGYGERGGNFQVWLDAWTADDADDPWPSDAHGVVCERHASALSAPVGWDFVDRRESAPRLFVPRPVLVHSRSVEISEQSPNAGSAVRDEPQVEPDANPRVADVRAAIRRRRVSELPVPQLFADLHSDHSEVEPVVPDDSRRDTEVENLSNHHDSSSMKDDGSMEDDDKLSSLLDATGPLLRRAFGKRNTGRHDASKELMRPTTHRVVDESA